MSALSAPHRLSGSSRARAGIPLGAVRGEFLRLAAVAVLAGNFVLGTYERSPVHTALIGGYLAVTLLSLFLSVRLPAAGWRRPLFVFLDAVAILHMLYMHVGNGPINHESALTPPGLVVSS